MQMNSTLPNQEFFAKSQSVEMSRSQFDRSHTYKTTFNAGVLIPFYIDEALPSDTVNLQARCFGRLATPLKPVMDNIFIDMHFFSVPYRLVWDNFKKMMGEQIDPDDSINYTIPQVIAEASGFTEGSNYDYLGIPTSIPNLSVSSLPLRAINLIWNEWYRDQDLQDSLTVRKTDTGDLPSDYISLLPRGKRKDYFTSARPWAQKGTPVSIPISVPSATVPVESTGVAPTFSVGSATNAQLYARASSNDLTLNASGIAVSGAANFGSTTGLEVTISPSVLGTIDQLNTAYKIQTFLQLDSRAGTRYTELIQSHFGVVSPDARLQRPEFLAGGTTYVNINPVAQTSNAASGSPQANLAAYGTFSGEPAQFVKSFTEHEIIIGFLSARADLTYQTGLDRMWSRKTRFDFYWREFANLGEQAILNKEIYAQGPSVLNPGGTPVDDDAFGYAERYAEYKFKHSKVTAKFRSNSVTSLDVWHLAQDFTALPTLSPLFVQENPPIDRIIAVPSEPQFIVDIVCDEKWARPMPVFAIPSFSTKF